MDIEMLLRLQQEQQIYLLNAKQFFDYHMELSRLSLLEQLDQVHRLEVVQRDTCAPSDAGKQLTSFKIQDILSNDAKAQGQVKGPAKDNKTRLNGTESTQRINSDANVTRNSKRTIVRPWSTSPRVSPCTSVETNLNNSDSISEEEIDVEQIDEDYQKELPGKSDFVSPLDALVEMSNKAFKGLRDLDSSRTGDVSMLNKSQLPKKKRKTRTAFSNQQIYELEKRFLYQKYLTPADRDEIASKLGLSCAQVITWFQNRRAKFKRDIEEMKNDVGAVSTDLNDDKCSRHFRE